MALTLYLTEAQCLTLRNELVRATLSAENMIDAADDGKYELYTLHAKALRSQLFAALNVVADVTHSIELRALSEY